MIKFSAKIRAQIFTTLVLVVMFWVIGTETAEASKVADWLMGRIGKAAASGATYVLVKILYWISLLLNFFLTVAGVLLDISIEYSILKTSSYTDILKAVSSVWTQVRDIFNITFIFVLLWVSIKTILGLSSANTKRMLVAVITSALLINFSLLATKLIIDGSNFLAVGLYSSAREAANYNMVKDSDEENDENVNNYSISSGIMQGTKIATIYAEDKGEEEKYSVENDKKQGGVTLQDAAALVVKIILSAVLIWAFFTAALLFVGRIILFIVLMALSPIGFIGKVIPYMETHSKKWWDTLFNQALVAPVFMVFMIIVLKISGSEVFKATETKDLDASAYFNFVMIAALVVIATKITRKLSGEVGAALTKLGTGMVTGALGLGLGFAGGALAGGLRKTAGAGLARLAESDGMKKWAANSRVGGALRDTAIAGSKATFDIRNTKLASVAKKAGVDVGKGGKKGYTDLRDDYAKKQAERAKGLSRDNLTEDEAVNEFRNEHQYTDEQKNADLVKGTNLVNKLSGESDLKKRREIQKEIAAHELSMKNKLARKSLLDNANKRDQFGNFSQDQESIKARATILEERKKAYQNQLADRLSREAHFFNNKKAAANKIRKGKTEEESFLEAARKLAEKKEKEAQQAGTNPAPAPAAPAPAAPPPAPAPAPAAPPPAPTP